MKAEGHDLLHQLAHALEELIAAGPVTIVLVAHLEDAVEDGRRALERF